MTYFNLDYVFPGKNQSLILEERKCAIRFRDSNHYYIISSVEIVGPRGNSCEVAALPEPLHGFTMAKLGRAVVACGGFHRYERYI